MISQKTANIEEKSSVIESAQALALGTLFSRILGFIRDALFFALFPRAFTDAYSVAFRLPNLFRRLLGEGALSASFMPLYISHKDPKALADGTFSTLLAATTTLSLLAILFMDVIVNSLVGDLMGYAAVFGKIELTVYLARIMMGYLVLMALYAFYTAIANARHFFLVPAMAPVLFNLVIIIFFLCAHFVSRELAAWGVIAGGSAQVLLVGLLLHRRGCLPRWTWNWRWTEIGKDMIPGILTLGLFQLLNLINTHFAASLEEGAQSYLYAADRILEFPQSLIAVSIGTALLPRFSKLLSTGDRIQFLAEINESLRLLLFLSLPAVVGMRLLALPMVSVLFERGEFAPLDSEWTAAVVEEYAALLLFASLARVLTPAFYAAKRNLLPAVIAAVVIVVHVFIGPWFLARWGVGGLGAATALSALLNFILLQFFFHRWIGILRWREILIEVLRWTPGLIALAGVIHFLPGYLNWFGDTLSLLLVILTGMVVYFALTLLCGSRESRIILRRILPI